MALLRSLGFRHMQREPSGLWRYVSEDTQAVGFETGAITPSGPFHPTLFQFVPYIQ